MSLLRWDGRAVAVVALVIIVLIAVDLGQRIYEHEAALSKDQKSLPVNSLD